MPRIGELLVSAGLVSVEQIEQAVRAQVVWGGRLGTNLVELGLIDLDTLANFLGLQRAVPAALARHFEQADPELQQRLSRESAERHSCVPLLRVGPGRTQVAIVSIEPLGPRARIRVADELLCDKDALVNAVAPELRVRYHLERVYGIPRGARFLRARGKTVPPFPQFPAIAHEDVVTGEEPALADVIEAAIDAIAEPEHEHEHEPGPEEVTRTRLRPAPVEEPVAPDDVGGDSEIPVEVVPPELDDFEDEPSTFGSEVSTFGSEIPTLDQVVATGPAPTARPREERAGRERRRYVPTIDAPAPPPETASTSATTTASLGRLKIRRIAQPASEAARRAAASLDEATRAIRRAIDRDKVVELTMFAIERHVPRCDAAVLLVVRGDTAIGWKGFCRAGTPIGELGVPLDQPGLLPRAISRGETIRDPIDDLTSLDRLLVEALHAERGDLVVIPVPIAGQVMCLVAMVLAPAEPTAAADAIAAALGTAFARLMRDASR